MKSNEFIEKIKRLKSLYEYELLTVKEFNSEVDKLIIELETDHIEDPQNALGSLEQLKYKSFIEEERASKIEEELEIILKDRENNEDEIMLKNILNDDQKKTSLETSPIETNQQPIQIDIPENSEIRDFIDSNDSIDDPNKISIVAGEEFHIKGKIVSEQAAENISSGFKKVELNNLSKKEKPQPVKNYQPEKRKRGYSKYIIPLAAAAVLLIVITFLVIKDRNDMTLYTYSLKDQKEEVQTNDNKINQDKFTQDTDSKPQKPNIIREEALEELKQEELKKEQNMLNDQNEKKEINDNSNKKIYNNTDGSSNTEQNSTINKSEVSNSNSPDESSVIETKFKEWINANNAKSRNLENFYASKIKYYTWNDVSVKAALNDKYKFFNKWDRINIGYANVNIKKLSDDKYQVTYDKSYNFEDNSLGNSDSGKIRSRLIFVKQNGRWVIVNESDDYVYYTSRG